MVYDIPFLKAIAYTLSDLHVTAMIVIVTLVLWSHEESCGLLKKKFIE